MIATRFYKGQGLGNQLWCYVVTRSIAADMKYDFGILSPEEFKGLDFLDLNLGVPVKGTLAHYEEKRVDHPLNGADIRLYDNDLMNVADDTEIDGIMQDEQYIVHRKNEIREWLDIKPEFDCMDYSSDDICIINFRGSGYVVEKELLLPPKYWRDAMKNMRKINPNFKFIVITEDPRTARTFFPDLEIHHFSIGKDYSIVQNAHYLILSNSSFAWFPAWLSTKLKYCIAPKYWARHNISDGFWCPGYSITTGWMYQDRNGDLQDYDSCKKELDEYIARNQAVYSTESGTFHRTLPTQVSEEIRIFKTLRDESSSFGAISTMISMYTRRTVIRLKKVAQHLMLK